MRSSRRARRQRERHGRAEQPCRRVRPYCTGRTCRGRGTAGNRQGVARSTRDASGSDCTARRTARSRRPRRRCARPAVPGRAQAARQHLARECRNPGGAERGAGQESRRPPPRRGRSAGRAVPRAAVRSRTAGRRRRSRRRRAHRLLGPSGSSARLSARLRRERVRENRTP